MSRLEEEEIKRKEKAQKGAKKRKRKKYIFNLCYEELISDYVFLCVCVFAVSSGNGPHPPDPSRKNNHIF